MKISEAISHGQLQLFQHLLTDMEAHGVMTLPEARVHIQSAINTAHSKHVAGYYGMRRAAAQQSKLQEPLKCPECGAPLQLVNTGEETSVMVVGCKKCRFSQIINGVS